MVAGQSSGDSAREAYRRALAECGDESLRLTARDRRWYSLRIISFLLGVGLLAIGYFAAPQRLPWIVPGWLSMALFLVAIVVQEQYAEARRQLELRQAVFARWLARLERRWDDLPIDHPSSAATESAAAGDLDLFGRASVYQLLSVANTLPGRERLAEWLVQPASADEIRARQIAAQRLSGFDALRVEFAVRSLFVGTSAVAPERFERWAGGDAWLARRPALLYWARLMPLAWLVLGGLLASGLLAPTLAAITAIGIVAINLLITIGFGGRIHDIFLTATGHASEISAYERLFALAGQLPDDLPWLANIKHSCLDGQSGACAGLASLRRMAFPASLWRAALWFLIYLVLQMTLLWDVHVLQRIEHWQQRFRASVGDWFRALGQIEAIVSLATLAHDYPDWAWPEIGSPTQQTWIANGLAHPLLPDDQRVANDVQLGPRGELLLVTGSNMSGKSTLLRAIGTNTVLAQAGGPVCATALRSPTVRLATSIRIRDSLSDGVSFYMAELRRLREVVELARGARRDPQPITVLYLLDEILRGTNSGERQVAVIRVLAALRQCQAFGAITTHDLELAGHPSLPQTSIVHFREHFERDADGRPTMTFDYRMQPGVCPTTNALKLLEIVGLELPEIDRPAPPG